MSAAAPPKILSRPTDPAATAADRDVPLRHAHADAHDHGPGPAHDHRHTPQTARARLPSPSLLRLSVWQRLAVAVPIGALLWALALAVIAGGNP